MDAVSYTHLDVYKRQIEDTIAILTDEEGNDIPVTMIQRWPLKRAMTNYKEKPRPFKLLETGVRVIDKMCIRDRLSSARAVRCRLKCHNERNPYL